LYQLCDTNYSHAQLEIQQAIADMEIAACVIVHSTAIVQERTIQIWCIAIPIIFPLWRNWLACILEEQQIQLFNEYLVDMFSRAEDERLQFIHKEQYRFRKGGLEEDESIGDKAELHPNNIYLLAS
ncbi:11139_t:CDS:2, partial [Dentiscutata erythropus]